MQSNTRRIYERKLGTYQDSCMGKDGYTRALLCCSVPNCQPDPLWWVCGYLALLKSLFFNTEAALPGKSELSVLTEHGAENLQVKTGKQAVEGGKGLLFKFHFLITSVLSLNLEADKSLGSRCSSIIFLLSPSKANPAGMSRGFGVHQQGCGLPAVPKKASECIMVGF